jgi:hypothetical protein
MHVMVKLGEVVVGQYLDIIEQIRIAVDLVKDLAVTPQDV